ncbi:MAG TPA: hypothetical protein VII33_11595, partial [Nakamurella sp.]
GLVLGVVSVQLPAIFPSTGGRSRPSWSRAADRASPGAGSPVDSGLFRASLLVLGGHTAGPIMLDPDADLARVRR